MAASSGFVRLPSALSPSHLDRVWWSLFVLALLPLGRLFYLGFTGGLGAQPVEFVIRSLGTWTLVFLCLTLSITPLRVLTGLAWLVRLRRLLGLYCFFYATLHLLSFVGLDQWFDLAGIWHEVVKRPYITAGFAAFTLLIPLAATSTNGMVKRLGGRNWQRLHRLVYLVALLAVLHYWWQKAGKNDFAVVSRYAAVVALLLAFRLWRSLAKRDRQTPSTAR